MILSTLWIFYVFNSAYGDITTVHNSVYRPHVAHTFHPGVRPVRRPVGGTCDRHDPPFANPEEPSEPTGEPARRRSVDRREPRNSLRWNANVGLRVHHCGDDRHRSRHCLVCVDVGGAGRVPVPIEFRVGEPDPPGQSSTKPCMGDQACSAKTPEVCHRKTSPGTEAKGASAVDPLSTVEIRPGAHSDASGRAVAWQPPINPIEGRRGESRTSRRESR
jgi:hypothetical protein